MTVANHLNEHSDIDGFTWKIILGIHKNGRVFWPERFQTIFDLMMSGF